MTADRLTGVLDRFSIPLLAIGGYSLGSQIALCFGAQPHPEDPYISSLLLAAVGHE